MKSTLIAAFAAPSIALAAIGAGPYSSGLTNSAPAYGATVSRLTADEARAHAGATFARADLDRSGALNADEYAALTTVTAELSRLNGFIALAADGRNEIVALPIKAPMALAGGERARVEAVARADFHAAAGADGHITRSEFASEQAARFAAADRNRNGALAKGELAAFAARAASIARSDA